MPSETTAYTLTATNAAGNIMPQVSVTVIPEPVIVSFTLSPQSVFAGEDVNLSWEVQNFTALEIDQMVGIVTGPTGSVVINPTESATYTLTATNANDPNGTATATVDVSVFPPRELLIHWPLDEEGGTVAADLSGNGTDGDWQGTVGDPGWQPPGGVAGGAFNFTGADADSFITSTFSSEESTPHTISLWVNSTSGANNGLASSTIRQQWQRRNLPAKARPFGFV
jgi:hypothetical protein